MFQPDPPVVFRAKLLKTTRASQTGRNVREKLLPFNAGPQRTPTPITTVCTEQEHMNAVRMCTLYILYYERVELQISPTLTK